MNTLLKTSFTLLLLTSVFTQATPTPAAPAQTPLLTMPRPVQPPANLAAMPIQTPPASKPVPTIQPIAVPSANQTPEEKSKFALLNTQKDSLNEDDLSSIFQQDLNSLITNDSGIDSQCGAKLDAALKAAAADPNALAFIFTQATEGHLCAMLNQNQSDIDSALKNFKDTEGFTPVANNNGNKSPVSNAPVSSAPVSNTPVSNAPVANATNNAAPNNAANNTSININANNNISVNNLTTKTPVANNTANVNATTNNTTTTNTAAANNTTTNATNVAAVNNTVANTTNTTDASKTTTNNNGNAVNTGNNADPKVVAAQKAAQEEQMKAAQAAINNLFSQVGTRMNMNSSMPNINFGAPSSSSPPSFVGNAANKDLGAGLARVAITGA